MSYIPKYCCQCGEKIDEIDRKFWASPRFCELCETDYGIYDKVSRGFVALGLIFGLFGIGSFLVKPEKTPLVAQNQIVVGNSNGKTETANQKVVSQVVPDSDVQTKTQIGNSAVQLKSQGAPSPTEAKVNRSETASDDASEAVYFCGAETKKGTLCSRRVKGGGRCWQHAGQPAMLPQAKLIAAR